MSSVSLTSSTPILSTSSDSPRNNKELLKLVSQLIQEIAELKKIILEKDTRINRLELRLKNIEGQLDSHVHPLPMTELEMRLVTGAAKWIISRDSDVGKNGGVMINSTSSIPVFADINYNVMEDVPH